MKCPKSIQLTLADGSVGHKSESEANVKATQTIQAIYPCGGLSKVWLHGLQIVGSVEVTALSVLPFLICKMELIRATIFRECCED